MGASPQFSLPPLTALCFVPFLYLQCCLLHPAIPARWSRPLRLLLMVPAVVLGAAAPFWFRIEPVQWSVGANFKWGIFGPYGVLKALEWGFVKDRSAYTWLGFDKAEAKVDAMADSETETPTSDNGHTTSTKPAGQQLQSRRSRAASLPTPPDSPTLGPSSPSSSPSRRPAQIRAFSVTGEPDVGSHGAASRLKKRNTRFNAEHATPLSIALDGVHLLTAMRGIGYSFGPPINSLATTPPRDRSGFFKHAATRFIRSHIISTFCLLILIERHRNLPLYLQRYLLPYLSLEQVQPLADLLSYVAVGVSLHAQMLVGFEGAKIVFLAIDFLPLPASIKPHWDAREWPNLFYRPFEPETVTVFWSQHWHALFRKPFTAVGFEPTSMLVGRVAGKRVGRAAGALVVFALSSWMHAQALYSARYGVEHLVLPSSLTFTQTYGGWIFFLSQAFAAVLESLYPALTGHRFPRKGVFAKVWSYAWVVGVGCVAGRCWIHLGLVDHLPLPENWGWQRFLLPTTALAPPPLFTV